MSSVRQTLAEAAARKEAFINGKRVILDEIDDILDRCAHDNGEMIVRALKELQERHRGTELWIKK
jgi:hypothetical protein